MNGATQGITRPKAGQPTAAVAEGVGEDDPMRQSMDTSEMASEVIEMDVQGLNQVPSNYF